MTGYLILPDLKWDQSTLSALYVQTIVRDRSLRSLRDLRPSHLPLLRKIETEGRRAVARKYGVRADELRLLLHYQPSYCVYLCRYPRASLMAASDHLHVHIVRSQVLTL
jgi:m7GpppX diphosphatase